MENIKWWWSVTYDGPNGCREAYVKGASYFEGSARREAERLMRDGEIITAWQRKDPIRLPDYAIRSKRRTVRPRAYRV